MKSSKLAAAMVLAGLSLGVVTSAQAGVVWYTDRSAWEAAAGTLSFTENFSGFRTDQSFRTAPAALNGMTIQQQGVDAAFRNQVDVATFQFGDNNGTTHASMFTDGADTAVRITFAVDNAAFGGESWQATGGEGAAVEIYDGATLLASHALGAGNGAFLGYVLNGGDAATSLRYRSVNDNGIAGSGEGFGYDNLAGRNASTTNVPVPGTAALLALGLGALTSVRRRK